jgi:polyhydroxyalkanoate synthase
MPLGIGFVAMDVLRRATGAWLDAVGLGPVETPGRRAGAGDAYELVAYETSTARWAAPGSPVVLLVPAPIKRAYIWDLAPRVSVVRRCVERGFRVYLLRWTEPDRLLGLSHYAGRAIREALTTVAAETGEQRAVLAGHSLGGTLAAIHAALHPERVRGLVLLESPLTFTSDGGGAFGPLLAAAPRARVITDALGNVPGSFLDVVSLAAAPEIFAWQRWVDRMASAVDPAALAVHQRVERWSLDEMPLSARLFEEVVESLYREDRFMRGTLAIDDQSAGPARIAAPLLAVVDPRSRLVPPSAVLPFVDAVASRDRTVIAYEGDVGVAMQHLGVLVGRAAHRHVWPRILEWIADH